MLSNLSYLYYSPHLMSLSFSPSGDIDSLDDGDSFRGGAKATLGANWLSNLRGGGGKFIF